jgi:hypothetical protein
MLRIPHCLDNRLTDGGKPYAPAAALLTRNIIFMLLVLISVRGSLPLMSKYSKLQTPWNYVLYMWQTMFHTNTIPHVNLQHVYFTCIFFLEEKKNNSEVKCSKHSLNVNPTSMRNLQVDKLYVLCKIWGFHGGDHSLYVLWSKYPKWCKKLQDWKARNLWRGILNSRICFFAIYSQKFIREDVLYRMYRTFIFHFFFEKYSTVL